MEARIGELTAAFTTNDSIMIAASTAAKQQLKGSPEVSISSTNMGIKYAVDTFFKDSESAVLLESSEEVFQSLADFIKTYPQYTVNVYGLSNTGEFEMTLTQAAVIGNKLTSLEVPVDNLKAASKDGGFKDGFLISLEPDFKSFYIDTKNKLTK